MVYSELVKADYVDESCPECHTECAIKRLQSKISSVYVFISQYLRY